jgi:voltage-gated potassium channel
MRFFRSRIAFALMLCTAVLVAGTIGFITIEGYSVTDGLYMSAITVTTVGFGEVQPLTPAGRLFTTGLILCSFMTLAFAGHTIGQSLLENVWSGQTERKKMKKQIASLKDHYIVCGYGRVGAAAVQQFEAQSADFVVIESDENQLGQLKDKGYLHINGDATHEGVLEDAGIKNARGLLSLLNEDPDNLFVVLSAREMNPTLNIISRSNEASSGFKIMRAGADDVVSPFDSAGKQIAADILRSTGRMKPSHGVARGEILLPKWITVEEGSSMMHQTIHDLSREMQRAVIGLRRDGCDRLMPDDQMKLLSGDQIMVLDENNDEKEKSALPGHKNGRKLVIIDDNPVIVKLYTRLFQKAGFAPIAATDGQDGLALILKTQPRIAVIDYDLPAMSGIEVCRNVRRRMKDNGIKLIMFTADSSPETRESALEAGADAVVVKSSEASEIIHTVNDFLNR